MKIVSRIEDDPDYDIGIWYFGSKEEDFCKILISTYIIRSSYVVIRCHFGGLVAIRRNIFIDIILKNVDMQILI